MLVSRKSQLDLSSSAVLYQEQDLGDLERVRYFCVSLTFNSPLPDASPAPCASPTQSSSNFLSTNGFTLPSFTNKSETQQLDLTSLSFGSYS